MLSGWSSARRFRNHTHHSTPRLSRPPVGGRLRLALLLSAFALFSPLVRAAEPDKPPAPKGLRAFLDAHCVSCHDTSTKRGGLDLEKLPADFQQPAAFTAWVKVHDKVQAGAMPPPRRERPPQVETDAALRELDAALVAADLRRREEQGRAVFRRLNRAEYENTLRDLLALPGLSVCELLPEDGRAHGFDKSGTALDLSFVQLAKYLEAADAALDVAVAPFADKPEVYRKRLYPAAQYGFMNLLLFGDAVFLKDMKYDHGTFPIMNGMNGSKEDKDHIADVVEVDKVAKKYEGSVGVFRHADEANHPEFWQFGALLPGRYRLKLSVWAFQWDKGEVKPARGTEAVRLTANGRLLGYFDAPSLKPTVHDVEVWLNRKDIIEFNAASLWPNNQVYNRPGKTAAFVGPGIAVDYLEVEGPLNDAWPAAGHRRLFGALPLGPMPTGDVRPPKRDPFTEWWPNKGENSPGKFTNATVASKQPAADAERLLADFLPRAFRRPVTPEEVQRYVGIVRQRLDAKVGFEEAMRTAYKAALCSPGFLFLKEAPGRLNDRALASRLSYFLWNSMPDDELSTLADQGKLRDPKVLRAQTERLLADPKVERFTDDFLDQWLDLRDINQTSPDAHLYPEFNPYLRDSMVAESRAYFHELLHNDLGAAYLVRSDFAMLNQELAKLYGIPGVVGSAIRRVALPPDSHRGGFLTQAGVLKITANGSNTSPVKRGVWVQSKILGRPPEPPPPDVPAIEPDTRGATTIREQLAKHRSNAACAACHAKIDPPGFALESYDVIGGWRQRYRAINPGDGAFHLVLAVDPSGEIAGGRAFADIEQFKKLLLEDERQLARNFVGQLVVYATGAPVGYADRAAVEDILDRAKPGGYGLRSLILEVVQSPLFQNK